MENIEQTLKKYALVILLIVVIAGVASIYPLGIFQPGFEGAKCHFYGANFRFKPDWTGTYQLHRYQDMEDPLVINEVWGDWHRIYWGSAATPNDASIGWRSFDHVEKPHLNIHVESNIQLEDITRQGDPDPLNWTEDNPLEGRRIEYWSKKGTKTIETEETVTYEYELTKESFLICPAEFWVGFYLIPSQDDAGTGSGWREGEWSDMVLWFRLDFHVWDNAYYDDWLDDPEDQVYTTEYGGIVISKERKVEPDAYRGGFPIAGWIQGWEKAGWTSDVVAGEQQSPVWYDVKGPGTGIYTDDQLHELRDILMSKVEFSPGMVGQFISLYDEPEVQFSYETSNTNYQPDSLAQSVKTPDTSMKKVMYFPINVENFGTYAEAHTWGLTGYTVYYPSAYFRVRMIYGVYGTFKYLWTEELAKDPVIKYPEEIERHGTTVIHTSGPLTPFADLVGGIGGWFSNPLNQLWTLFVVLIIVIVIATLLNPGLWTSILDVYKSRGKSSRKSKGRKWKK